MLPSAEALEKTHVCADLSCLPSDSAQPVEEAISKLAERVSALGSMEIKRINSFVSLST